MEKLMKIWLVLFTVYLILYAVNIISDRNHGRYVSIGESYTGSSGTIYKILDKRTGKVITK